MAAQDTGAQRVANCHAGHQERGLKLVRVWVPEQDVERIRKQAFEMRQTRDLPLPSDTWGDWVWVRVATKNSPQDTEEDTALRWRFSSNHVRKVGDEFWRVRESWVTALGLENRLVPDPETKVA